MAGDCLFVFIGGGSGAGKSSITKLAVKSLRDQGISVQQISLDDYYYERPLDIPAEIFRETTNFDTPDMLDIELFTQHVTALCNGETVTKPMFEFTSNLRKGEERVAPSQVIIVEGIFAQHIFRHHLPLEIPAISVHIATDRYHNILTRRTDRDTVERDRKACSVRAQEQQYVGPGFLRYTASGAIGSDLYINNEEKLEKVEELIQLKQAARSEEKNYENQLAHLRNKANAEIAGSEARRTKEAAVRALEQEALEEQTLKDVQIMLLEPEADAERHAKLGPKAEQIATVIIEKLIELDAGVLAERKHPVDPRELVARSHLIAQSMFDRKEPGDTSQFRGIFTGVFGDSTEELTEHRLG